MPIWFEADRELDSTIDEVKDAYSDLGQHFVAVVGLLPGLTSVELVEEGSDSVTIRTSEGLMKRTNITKGIEVDSLVVEFDEEYQAGSRVTVTSHYWNEVTTSAGGVRYHLRISDVEAPGFLGSLYRRFGSSKMGNAYLTASKTHLET